MFCKTKKERAYELLLQFWDELQKSYQLQFTHFMEVFKFWIVIVGVPVSIGIISSTELEHIVKKGNFVIGILLIILGILAAFISVKMYDIRGSQLKYIGKLNKIQKYLWDEYKVTEITRLQIPFTDTSMSTVAVKDFGIWMAIIMSLINGLIFSSGVFLVIIAQNKTANCAFCYWLISWLIFFAINKSLYYIFTVIKADKD